MAKYTVEERKRAVELLIQYDLSIHAVISELGYPSRGMLYLRYREYQACGNVDKFNQPKSKYSPEQRKQAIEYVCTDGLGNLIKPSHVTQRFSDLLKKHNMKHIRFHDLRHTFASLLINKGVPLINVSNTLGHSTIATTANIYGHLDMESKRSTANIMNRIFGDSDKN